MEIIKNYLYNIYRLIGGTLFPFLIFPYVSRQLDKEILGQIAFSQSVTNYFLVIALLGVSSYGIRELSKAKLNGESEICKVFTELISITLISSIASFTLFICLILKIKNA